jgi:hypothetical protein
VRFLPKPSFEAILVGEEPGPASSRYPGALVRHISEGPGTWAQLSHLRVPYRCKTLLEDLEL